jgi:hypothetical protein
VNWIFTWVVTSPKYVPMGIVSAASFHLCNPESELCWLLSEEAAGELERRLPKWLFGVINQRVVVGAGEDPIAASRRLRLSVTEQVRGNLVAVDADILCVRPIEVAVEDVPLIGACPNLDNDGNWNEDPEWTASRKLFTEVGWDWPCSQAKPYLNAGLVFYRDAEECREFGRLWRRNRDEFLQRTGKYFDQPAFNKTAQETGYVKVLDTSLNAPVYSLPRTAKGARCFHFYVSGAEDGLFGCTTLGFFANKVANREPLDRDDFQEMLDKRQAFVGWGAIDRQYLLAGQWQNYLERKLRVGWDHFKKKLKC